MGYRRAMRAGLVDMDPRRWLSPKPRYHGLGHKGERGSDLGETALARCQEDADEEGSCVSPTSVDHGAQVGWLVAWPSRDSRSRKQYGTSLLSASFSFFIQSSFVFSMLSIS